MRYFEGYDSPVAPTATKYDDFVLKMTGNAYRCQPKAGRAIVLSALAEEGITLRELCRRAAQDGVETPNGRRYFPSGFVSGSALKHLVSPTRIFSLEHPEGLTVEEVSRTRTRAADPAVEAARQAKREEIEARKAQRAEAKATKERARSAAREQKAQEARDRKAAKAEEREAKKREREAARLAREEQKRANDEVKAAAAKSEAVGVASADAAPKKGKGKRKASVAAEAVAA